MNLQIESSGGRRDLPVRNGAHGAHPAAKHRVAGDLDIALFRGVRRGDRFAHHRDRGCGYGAFIVPGLVMMMLLTQSVANASFGIYFPRFTGTIYELLSAPISFLRSCSAMSARQRPSRSSSELIILATAGLFVSLRIDHPVWTLVFLRADGSDLQPARLHHRHLGRRIREAAGRAAAGHHAAELPRRQLLFDQGSAAGLAGRSRSSTRSSI